MLRCAGSILSHMTTIQFELERTIQAPIDQVFARLIDINGYNEWMDRKSLLKQTRQTSPGEPAVGTTYEDDTKQGSLPGEFAEFEAPYKVVFHWWEKSKNGKVTFEGWPGFSLQSSGEDETLVRHHATLNIYGAYRLAKPVFRRLAVRERTLTIEALKKSFEPGSGSARA